MPKTFPTGFEVFRREGVDKEAAVKAEMRR
jgi:hypothetical protein